LQSLARLGGETLAIDASASNIAIAELHASQDPFLPFGKAAVKGNRGSLEYRHTSAEALRDAGEQFDVVCSMEVLEHVDEPREFLKCLGDMVKVRSLSAVKLTLARGSSRSLNHLSHTVISTVNVDFGRRRTGTSHAWYPHVRKVHQAFRASLFLP
jgi:2-polyprenyl-3-methyl-5-hydroxy-6-metoxy-1,4-benzoquinol methylase